jgi:hypothetical protein
MDTNSIQPITNTELKEASASKQVSFAHGYLRTTSALGVWPISAISSVAAVGLLTFFMGQFFVFAVGSLLSSFAITIVCWLGLSWFRWPVALKAVLSVWAAIFAGLMPLLFTFNSGHFYNITAHSVMGLLFFVFVTMVIPPLTISVVTVLPYVITELLQRNNSIAEDTVKICQSRKNGEEQE